MEHHYEEIMKQIDCRSCNHYIHFKETLYDPEEIDCDDGGFGYDYPCDTILGFMEQFLDHNAIEIPNGFIATAAYCEETAETEYPRIQWKDHSYWACTYNDEDAAQGFDTLKAVWHEFFC